MEKVAIFGAAGPIGRYVGMELDRRGVPFRAVGRTASKLAAVFGKLPHAKVVAADSYCWTQKEIAFNKGGFELARHALSSKVRRGIGP